LKALNSEKRLEAETFSKALVEFIEVGKLQLASSFVLKKSLFSRYNVN
jgi:hypothetical protein